VTAKQKSRKNHGILICVFMILVTGVIASSGSGDPAQRLASSELALSWAAIICFSTNFIASILYLTHRRTESDALALAAAQAGVIFFGTVLVGGSLWFHHLFSAWWTWNIALTLAVLVWPVYVSYLLLRHYANHGQASTLAAVIGIFAFLDLPLAYFSIALKGAGASTPRLNGAYPPTVWRLVSFALLAAAGTWLLYRRERNQQEAADQEAFPAQ
jgi:heme exporter protein C